MQSATNASKKRKRPQPIIPPPMKSRKQARKLTTLFHKYTHEQEHLRQNPSLPQNEKKAKLEEIEGKINSMGGRKAYQEASILSTSFHKTSKWVFQLLTKYQLRPAKKEKPLKVLEIGAINTQLLSCPWLDVYAIDLESRDARIHQVDFFTLKPRQEYDVIVSSMVINCVPEPRMRGEMLEKCYDHLKPGGHLFLMLPLLCLKNSKHMSVEHFMSLLRAIGFELKDQKESPKIGHFALQKGAQKESEEARHLRKFAYPPPLLKPGKNRIDFSICWEPQNMR